MKQAAPPLTDSSAAAPPESRSGIQVIERMMSILDALATHPDPVSLKQLAAETELHPSTTHRILAAMTGSGFVERAEAGTYRLGMRLLELGNVVRSRLNIRDAAMPMMQKLHKQIGESVNLGTRQGDEIIYVERTSSGRSSVRVVHLIGARAPLHVTSVGKLYLAEARSSDVRAYAERTGLPRYTPTSITTLTALEAELNKIKTEGVSYDNEEIETGLRCIAAPVRDDSGVIVGGLSISAPAERFNPAWVPIVRQVADELSATLGYTSS